MTKVLVNLNYTEGEGFTFLKVGVCMFQDFIKTTIINSSRVEPFIDSPFELVRKVSSLLSTIKENDEPTLNKNSGP